MTATLIDPPDESALLPASLSRRERVKKSERRHARDQVRRISAWEQYRSLWDGIDFKRQLINMGDKKVRFALVIAGALNAVLILTLAGDPTLSLMTKGMRATVATLMVSYVVATLVFMTHAIEALRPAPEARKEDSEEWDKREFARASPDDPRPIGLIIRGPLQNVSFDEERYAWSTARLSEINAELILFNRASSFILGRQQEQLRKVYRGLQLLVILAGSIFVFHIASGVLRSRASMDVGTAPASAGLALQWPRAR